MLNYQRVHIGEPVSSVVVRVSRFVGLFVAT